LIQHGERFLSHAALRLTCNHVGYASLWTEQVGDEWCEPTPKHTWPVLAGDDAKWAVRAAIDAVVAEAYGLTREQYTHVLSSFSHRSYPKAPELCLAAFDELKTGGLDAFTKKPDPYWDIPLNENLARPVIQLPIPDETNIPSPEAGALFAWAEDSAKGKPLETSDGLAIGFQQGENVPCETLLHLLAERESITSRDARKPRDSMGPWCARI